jgi:hypothetical protein
MLVSLVTSRPVKLRAPSWFTVTALELLRVKSPPVAFVLRIKRQASIDRLHVDVAGKADPEPTNPRAPVQSPDWV